MLGLKLIHVDIIKGSLDTDIWINGGDVGLLAVMPIVVIGEVADCHLDYLMMTSSNGNIMRVTGHLCGEFPGEFPAQRPVTRSFHVFFDLCLNKPYGSKQSWGWWFETLSRPLWRHCNVFAKQPSTTFLWQVPKYYLTVLLSDEAPIIQ